MLKIFSLVKKGLSLSINFKYLVGWKKPSALEREDETDSWLEEDSLSGCPWVALSVSAPLSKADRRGDSEYSIACVCGVAASKAGPGTSQHRFTSPFHTLNWGFS